MAENKSKVRKIIIGTVIAIMVIAVAVTGAVLIKKSTQKKPEPEPATKTSTLPVSTTSPYVVLSDIDTNFRIKQIIGTVYVVKGVAGVEDALRRLHIPYFGNQGYQQG